MQSEYNFVNFFLPGFYNRTTGDLSENKNNGLCWNETQKITCPSTAVSECLIHKLSYNFLQTSSKECVSVHVFGFDYVHEYLRFKF